MSILDELTMGEIDRMRAVALRVFDPDRDKWVPASFENADPMQLAAAMMWVIEAREKPDLEWDAFRNSITSSDVQAFHELHGLADELDPTNAVESIPNSSTPRGSGATGESLPASTAI